MGRVVRDKPFEEKLRSYSRTAASALMVLPAAVSMTALMPSRVDAAIHYSGIRNIPVPVMNKYSTVTTTYNTGTNKYGNMPSFAMVDMDSDGSAEMVFLGFAVSGSSSGSNPSSSSAQRQHVQANLFLLGEAPTVSHIQTQTTIAKYSTNEGQTETISVPQNLPSGYSIGSQANWGNKYDKNGLLDFNINVSVSTHTTGSGFVPAYTIRYHIGNFNRTTGYLGVRFESSTCNNGNYNYGWIRFSESADGSQATIIDWAYDDQCDTPILAGAGALEVTVPALNQWGILALVALLAGSGAVAMRRREES